MSKTTQTKQSDKARTIPAHMAFVAIAVSAAVLATVMYIADSKLQLAWQARQIAAVRAALSNEHQAGVASKRIHTTVTARSAIVYDVTADRVLYAKRPDLQLPLASVTKLMTALLADEILGASTTLRISRSAFLTEGDSGLRPGDVWRVRALSDHMLAASSNDAAVALAERAGGRDDFVQRMNMRAQALGLMHTIYFNESGLDTAHGTPGAVGTARDIAHLLGYLALHKPELIEATTVPSFTARSQTALQYPTHNTNKALSGIPGMLGGKTGYTDLAGGNLAVVFEPEPGRIIAIVVLGSTRDERFTDVLHLVDEVFNM